MSEYLRFKQGRLSRIKEAKAVLEREAREQAEQKRFEQEKKRQDREASGKKERIKNSPPPGGSKEGLAEKNTTRNYFS